MTIPDYKKKLGLPRKIGIAKKLGLPEEQPEISEIPKKSLELAKPRSKPLNLFQQYWRENMKVTIKMINQRAGTVVEQQGLTIQCSVYSCFV